MSFYYDPPANIELIAEVGDGGGYDWNIACVWRDLDTGKLHGGSDSGCSCYGPFDPSMTDVATASDLPEITSRQQARELADEIYESYATEDEKLTFVNKVAEALK